MEYICQLHSCFHLAKSSNPGLLLFVHLAYKNWVTHGREGKVIDCQFISAFGRWGWVDLSQNIYFSQNIPNKLMHPLEWVVQNKKPFIMHVGTCQGPTEARELQVWGQANSKASLRYTMRTCLNISRVEIYMRADP